MVTRKRENKSIIILTVRIKKRTHKKRSGESNTHRTVREAG